MGNSQAQLREQIESKFVISEIPSIASKNLNQQNIVVNQRSDDTLDYYFVSNKGVELQSMTADGNKKNPMWFAIGEKASSIVHTLILNIHSSSILKQIHDENSKNSCLVALFLADNKLTVLNGDELHCIKTIQLFAPLEAFKISLINNLSFTIKEDVLHKAKQQQLMDELIQQRPDFTKFFPEIKRNNVLQQEKRVEEDSDEEQNNSESPNNDNGNNEKDNEQNIREKRSSSNSNNQSNASNSRRDSKSNPSQGAEKKNEAESNERQKIHVYNEFMKAQYEIFVHSSKVVTKDLLDIVAVSNCGQSQSSKGVVLVGYKCGLIQKVTVEKANIEVEEECIFFNPLNLKPQSELELIVKSSSDGDTVPWSDLNILPLRYVFCVNGSYVIAVHSEAILDEGQSNSNLVKTLVYVYEYQNGKKIAYFDASTSGSLTKAFVNSHEVTNRNILFLLDSKNNLNLYNFEKGTFLQSFQMAQNLKIIDVRPCFFKKSKMFAKLSDVFTLFKDVTDKKLDRTIEGDIFLFFTEDSQVLVTQLDYKLATQTIPDVVHQKETTKKVLNLRALKILRSKVSCRYRDSAYEPNIDQLVLAGENGQLFQFPNFLASIFYYL